jgi:hypothetical protein
MAVVWPEEPSSGERVHQVSFLLNFFDEVRRKAGK